MRSRLELALKISVSVAALGLSSVPIFAQNILSRAQVVGGADACPAIFVSFNSPLAVSSSSVVDGGRGLRIRLNRGTANITSAGSELIETYPSLNLPTLGQVGITLDSGGTEPVLVMRFDQAIAGDVAVVQAGDNSIVVTGISAGGVVACGAEASPQDPLSAEVLAPPGAPSLAGLAGSAQAQVEDLYSEARAAITAQDYRRAAQLLTKLTEMPLHARSADAQELLGVVRERNGQFAHAQAEYEIYLETFPDSAGVSRVRQRLAALLTAVSTPLELRDAGPGFTGPADGPIRTAGVRSIPRAGDSLLFEEEGVPTFSATLSSYYYLNQGSTAIVEFDTNTTQVDNDVFDNNIVTSLNMSDIIETEGFTLEWRFSGEYQFDLLNEANSKLPISKAYADFTFNNQLGLRLGRQTRFSNGIFGRFDGALLTWPVADRITTNLTVGAPVNSTKDGFFASNSTVVGASVEFADIRPGLDTSVYFVQQSAGGLTERQAVGVEAQFQNDNTSAYALVDYDTSFDMLNLAKVSGTRIFANQASLTVSYDYAHSPLLSIFNTAVEQSTTTRSFSVAYSTPISEMWMASLNGSTFQTTKFDAVNGNPAAWVTTDEVYFSAQLVGNSVFSERDVVSVTARYADTATSQLVLVDAYRRFQVGENVRLNTRVKVGHRERFAVAGNSVEWFATPSVNLTYRRTDTLDFEVELGGNLSSTSTTLTTINTNDLFLFAGFSKQF